MLSNLSFGSSRRSLSDRSDVQQAEGGPPLVMFLPPSGGVCANVSSVEASKRMSRAARRSTVLALSHRPFASSSTSSFATAARRRLPSTLTTTTIQRAPSGYSHSDLSATLVTNNIHDDDEPTRHAFDFPPFGPSHRALPSSPPTPESAHTIGKPPHLCKHCVFARHHPQVVTNTRAFAGAKRRSYLSASASAT